MKRTVPILVVPHDSRLERVLTPTSTRGGGGGEGKSGFPADFLYTTPSPHARVSEPRDNERDARRDGGGAVFEAVR